MPTFVPRPLAPGLVAPGQFGPISRAPYSRTEASAPTMSCTGIPSVMQKIVFTPASAASAIASAAPEARTINFGIKYFSFDGTTNSDSDGFGSIHDATIGGQFF